MKELWKAIPGYENYYEASNLGNVRSIDRTVKQKCRHGGYRTVTYQSKVLKTYNKKYKRSNISQRKQVVLSVNMKTKTYDLHKLIALTWIPNPKKLDTVNHKDGNTFNNNIKNLEWISKADNNRHAFRKGIVKTQKLVAMLDPHTLKIIKVFPGESEACRRIGVSQGKVGRAARENYKSGGYRWKYVNVEDKGVTTIEPWIGFK